MELRRARQAWDANKLDISNKCVHHVGFIIAGIPEIQRLPGLRDLRERSKSEPPEAIISLVDDFIDEMGLWKQFLAVLDKVGLQAVREEYFTPEGNMEVDDPYSVYADFVRERVSTFTFLKMKVILETRCF